MWQACLFSTWSYLVLLVPFSALIKPSHGARSLWLLAWLPPRPDVAISPPNLSDSIQSKTAFNWWRKGDKCLSKLLWLKGAELDNCFGHEGSSSLPSQESLLPAVLNNLCLCGCCSAHTNFELYIFFQEICIWLYNFLGIVCALENPLLPYGKEHSHLYPIKYAWSFFNEMNFW